METKFESSAEYPMVLIGVGIKRWERLPQDAYMGVNPNDGKVLFGTREIYWDRSWLTIGVDRAREHWGPSSVQYASKAGFLLSKRPLMFCCWYQFRKQTPGVPGSEKVFYWRIGTARWDPNMGGGIKLKFKILGKQFVFGTWYGPGLHWD
jgi:hypothetical protein